MPSHFVMLPPDYFGRSVSTSNSNKVVLFVKVTDSYRIRICSSKLSSRRERVIRRFMLDHSFLANHKSFGVTEGDNRCSVTPSRSAR
jgi:hypothetical protein